ncbi:MAG: hypothetical protein RID09_11325 [Coleofasciculus sp. G1-WW12-02]
MRRAVEAWLVIPVALWRLLGFEEGDRLIAREQGGGWYWKSRRRLSNN